jgi:outer membrane protein TolC
MNVIGWVTLSANILSALSVCALFVFYARRSALGTVQRNVFSVALVGAVLGWLLLTALLSSIGIFQAGVSRPSPATAVGLLFALLGGIMVLSRSATLNAVVDAIPAPWLVAIQVYRLVGLVFLVLFADAQMPGEFAIPAGAGDALVGGAAPILAYAMYRGYSWSNTAALVWNVAGIVDLLVAVGTGFLSSPGPLQMLAFDHPNFLITAFPLVLVPVFAVPLWIVLHLALWKRLRRGGQPSLRAVRRPQPRGWAVGASLVASLVISAPALAQPATPTLDPRPAAQTLDLTLEDAVRRALDNNPNLAIVRLDTEVQTARVAESRTAFTPVFSTTFGRSSTVTPPQNSLLGERGVDVDDVFSSTGVRQRLPWGSGTWSVSWEAARTTTNNPLTSFDPSLQSGFQFAFSQPLLRDRKIDAARHQYVIARKDEQSSDLRFRESVVQTVAAVKQAYWTLKATRANIDVQRRSLDLARELARENKVRVDAGHIPPIDLVQAEAEVAQRRENLIRAQTAADDAEDVLRRLIVNAQDVSFWKLRLEPVEEPSTVGPLPDIDAAVAKALDQRYDIARAGHDLEKQRATIEYLDNQKLPDVRLETSYRGNGLAGTQFLRSGGFPGSITGTRNRGFGDALGQVFSDDYPAWSVGLTVSYPLGTSYEAASLARTQVERRQTAQRIASLRIEAAETVRRAGRQVRSTAERVEAARAGAALAQERLDSEQRRFNVGLSTTFLVTQAQRDLLEAQVNLLQTTLEYESSLVNFDAVQQAPPLTAGATLGINGSNVVVVPIASPRGLFRQGAGF